MQQNISVVNELLTIPPLLHVILQPVIISYRNIVRHVLRDQELLMSEKRLTQDQLGQLGYDLNKEYNSLKRMAQKIDDLEWKIAEHTHDIEMAQYSITLTQGNLDLRSEIFFRTIDEYPYVIEDLNTWHEIDKDILDHARKVGFKKAD